MDIERRFWAKVEKLDDGCWIWTAAQAAGYGLFSNDHGQLPRLLKAHRFSWRLKHGPIPKGLCVLHHCDNPLCVNPDHLWLGTVADNNADMRMKGRSRFVLPERDPEYRGTRIPSHVLDEEQVRDIRSLHHEGWSNTRLGKRYGVSKTTIFKIIHRQTWNHV